MAGRDVGMADTGKLPDKPRVLVISVSAGVGHLRAAEALVAAFRESYPEVHAETIDCLRYSLAPFRKIYAGSYIAMCRRHPMLWGYFYYRYENDRMRGPAYEFRSFIERLNTRAMIKYIREFEPAHIVCTHFLPCEVLGKFVLKNKISAPVSCVVTDFDVHTFWVHPHVSTYFVASEEIKWTLSRKISTKPRIEVTGIPINPKFTIPGDREVAREKLGLSQDLLTVLVMAGGFGVGGVSQTIEAILELGSGVQVIAVAGRNPGLAAKLQERAKDDRVKMKVFGFVDNVYELMDASDLIVTKAGGLTVCECLAKSLPMVLIGTLPGQEEGNADYLVESGAAIKARNPHLLAFKLRELAGDRQRVLTMRENVRRIARPRAAFDIARVVAEDIKSRASGR